MRRLALAPTLVCAFLSPSAAFGLGIGDIELQSALNQPLEAEIPLRGISAGEGDDIVVALASEEAYRQVGLERPFALTRLQFEVVTRGGSHFIQVTSREPISEPFLNFLIEVDAPDGNLLREYTVLLDPPVFASEGPDRTAAEDGREKASRDSGATAPDVIVGTVAEDAPAEPADDPTAMNGRIDEARPRAAEEEPASPAVGQSAEEAGDSEVLAERSVDEGEFGDTPVFLEVAREEEEAERRLSEESAARAAARTAQAEPEPEREPEPAPMAAAAEPAVPDEYGAVQEGETLWDIAEELRQGDASVQQMMLALLRYNPEAFEDGNVNRLKEGYVLRVPDAEDVRSVPAQRAIAGVREQNGLWREWRDSLDQGGATQLAAAQDEGRTDGDASGADEGAVSSASRGGDSRLDIVGADEGGATSDESASATASTSSVSEELKLAREELASVSSEKAELADRVAHLEDTVDKMEQLVTVREEQLAQLQQQLREVQEQAGSTEGGARAQADEDDGADEAVAAGPAGEAGADEGGDRSNGGAATASADDAAGGADNGAEPQQVAADGDDAAGAQETASDEPREVVTPTEPAQKNWLDSIFGLATSVAAVVSGVVAGLTSGGMLPAILGAVALIVLGSLLLVVRRRRAARALVEEEFATPVSATAGTDDDLPADDAASEAGAEFEGDDADVSDDAASALMDEDLDLSAFDLDAAPGGGGDPDADSEKDETLVEADTYLAYGLHQQAEDLLRLALEESPNRHDYHEKLLETLYAAGKSAEFTSAADSFRTRLDDPTGAVWQRISIMGREIAPQHALFAAAASANEVTDDDLEFDLSSDDANDDSFTQALLSEAENVDAIEMPDLGAPAPATAASSEGDDDLAFDLSDLDEPAAAGVATEARASAGGNDEGALDFDISDLGLDSAPSSGAADSAAAAQTGAGDGSPQASSDDGGLDFDLGDLGDLGDFGSASESTGNEPAAAGGGNDTDAALNLDQALGLDDDGDAADSHELDTDDFGVGDLDTEPAGAPALDDPEPVGEAADATADDSLASAPADPAPVVDFDFSSLEQELDHAGAAADSSAETEAAASGGGNDEGEDLATMLDLAKAYIDMGDAESASNALEEVIAAGSDEQRAEARNLLETVQ